MAAARKRGAEPDLMEAPPRSDAYTGMLIVAFLATLTGLGFLFLDLGQYPDKKPDFGQINRK
jgi:hypothetical protein